jgi:hypothetical protein
MVVSLFSSMKNDRDADIKVTEEDTLIVIDQQWPSFLVL